MSTTVTIGEDTGRVRLAFDDASSWYDDLHANDPAWRAARAVTHSVFLTYFRHNDRLLEINCGTGIDALALATQGMSVYATDISEGMIEAARAKIEQHGLSSRARAEVLGFEELGTVRGDPFDGGYSNFDGLNCIQDPGPIARELARLIRPGGYFVATILPDFCLWETLSMFLRLNVAGAFRRRSSGGVEANLGGKTFRTFYYSPEGFARHFTENFKVVGVLGLNIFTPPMNHLRAYRILRPILPILYRVDALVSRLPVFRRIGDQMIIVLQRNPA